MEPTTSHANTIQNASSGDQQAANNDQNSRPFVQIFEIGLFKFIPEPEESRERHRQRPAPWHWYPSIRTPWVPAGPMAQYCFRKPKIGRRLYDAEEPEPRKRLRLL
ncbi:hypothetical protein EST38_g2093 [Candolleomyces aberdarensis]|uniref:Uncharacterized protein n=1 Tax=Candolleomyces aberdarensis TaxID=2316362 RepID=A0A4Q2DVJ1_9AGAR|nr:hypothetical protein EST38_g2093 [Candolleomyces aberdarensis]